MGDEVKLVVGRLVTKLHPLKGKRSHGDFAAGKSRHVLNRKHITYLYSWWISPSFVRFRGEGGGKD